MVKKNYCKKIKDSHKTIVAKIADLMRKHNVSEVDLMGSDADYAFILGVPDFDWDNDHIEADVCKVILEDGKVKLEINWDIDTEEYLAEYGDENGDIGALYPIIDANDFERVVPCVGIKDVYDSVLQVLE